MFGLVSRDKCLDNIEWGCGEHTKGGGFLRDRIRGGGILGRKNSG